MVRCAGGDRGRRLGPAHAGAGGRGALAPAARPRAGARRPGARRRRARRYVRHARLSRDTSLIYHLLPHTSLATLNVTNDLITYDFIRHLRLDTSHAT